jgi:N-acetylglucosaminyldiphosphoundecaprenol N-acetyl-beta-D-mannosaminyltransferase
LKKYLLGVGIDDVNLKQATEIVEDWLEKGGKHYIVTPNPEFLVDAQQDLEFKNILNKADLSIPDGRGLRIGTDIVCNTPGIDLMETLVKLSAEKGFTTGFLGGRNQVAEKTVERLQKKYQNLKVPYISEEPTKIPKLDILFVAFGAPKQEKWIDKNLDKIPVKVAMGVGGAFDYISGKVPRAPKLLRDLGLEWLFRLIVQPWRIKRQLKLLRYLWLVLN